MIFKYISLKLISFWPIFAHEGLFGSTLTWKNKHHKKSNFIAMNLRVFFYIANKLSETRIERFSLNHLRPSFALLNRPFDFKRTQIEPEIQSSLMRFRKIPKKKSKFSQASWAPLKYWKTKRDQARKWTEYFIFIASSPFRPLIGRPDVFFFFFFFSFFFSFFFFGLLLSGTRRVLHDGRSPSDFDGRSGPTAAGGFGGQRKKKWPKKQQQQKKHKWVKQKSRQ